jgi:mxaD protein
MTRFWTAVAILLATPVLAHGPTPIKDDEAIAIAASPGVVWAVAGQFDGLAGWHPDVKAVKATGGNGAGAEREVVLKAGGVLKEGLDEYDAAAFKYSYRMSDPDLDALPVSSYAMTFVVTPAAGGSEVRWSARFYRGDTGNEPPENLDDDAARAAMSKFLRDGLAGLKAKIEGR